ncbi:MAG TPA: AI-2E family transporter [Candidatus Saccharimonadales bacterium]|nr:AI-2E family transporter [Candidatus Saccharimonadales bacterium]
MDPRQKVTFTITNRTILRTILWILATIILYKFIGHISHGLTLIFISFFLALALNPVVGTMGRRLRIKGRASATAAAYLLVLAILAVFLALVVPPLVRQTRTFISNVPNTVQDFQNQNSRLAQSAKRYHLDEKITQSAKDFASHYSNFGGTLLNTGKRLIEAIASLFAVLVMTFMMLVEGPRWLDKFWAVVPAKKRAHHQRIAQRMYKGVSGFVNGQVILAVVAGVFAFIALEVFSRITNVSVNAVALAGIVSVFGLIPLFGNPLAAIVVILTCLINSVSLGLIMLIYFVVYFFIENHTFQPYIQSRLNELTPLTVFVAAVLGIGFGGLLGAIIAIPAASAVKILVEDYFESHGQTAEPVNTGATEHDKLVSGLKPKPASK